jgi:hypothetical protein
MSVILDRIIELVAPQQILISGHGYEVLSTAVVVTAYRSDPQR